MFDTQRVSVKVYRWDDEGAPQVESAAGSIKTILKACLVTGYGEGNKRKDGLGWEMAFEKAQEACFRSTHPKAMTQNMETVQDTLIYAVFWSRHRQRRGKSNKRLTTAVYFTISSTKKTTITGIRSNGLWSEMSAHLL